MLGKHISNHVIFGKGILSAANFLPLYSVLDLWRVGCHQMRTCTGMGQIVAQRAACTQAAMTKHNNARLGPRQRPKRLL